MVDQTQTNNNYIPESEIRLNEIEEKQRLLRDRTILIGENLISSKEELEDDIIDLKKRVKELEYESRSLKQLVNRLSNIISDLARKEDLEILKNQMKMFQPLGIRERDIRRLIKEESKK